MDKIFENTETAFALKTDSELERALFRMIANEPLVRDRNSSHHLPLKYIYQ